MTFPRLMPFPPHLHRKLNRKLNRIPILYSHAQLNPHANA